jgi:hypothetical protein
LVADASGDLVDVLGGLAPDAFADLVDALPWPLVVLAALERALLGAPAAAFRVRARGVTPRTEELIDGAHRAFGWLGCQTRRPIPT